MTATTMTRIAAACLVLVAGLAQAQAPAPKATVAAAPAARAAASAAPALAVSSAYSVPAGGPVMNLSQAYEIALQEDATLRMARADADAKRERLPQARSQLLPNISASATRFRNHLFSVQPGLTGPVNGNQRYTSSNNTLTIRQPLFRPFALLDYQQAKAQVTDANAQLEKAGQDFAVRLASAYMQALFAEDQLALVLSSKAAYTTQLDAAKKLLAGGSGVRTDVDESQARLDMALAQELEARQNIAYSRRGLQVLVNLPVAQLAPIDESRLQLVGPMPERLEDWTERAEQISPELISLRAQREAARLDVEKSYTGHAPTLDAIAQWSVSGSDTVNQINSHFDQRSIGVQLTVPLYSGGYVNSQTRQALASLEKVDDALEATRRDLALRIEKQYRGITEGIPRIRALEQAVRSADVAVDSAAKSFKAGARTLVDVLNAQQQQANARQDLANARYTYLLARIQLRALAGDADASVIAEVNGWLKP